MHLSLPANHAALLSNAYYGGFALLFAAECRAARRAPNSPRPTRWPANIALGVLNIAVVAWLFPILGVALAAYAQQRGWGWFNHHAAPDWLAVAVSVLALDLAYYGFHRLEHRVPLLWRFHRVHHCDTDVDVSTGLRHHPAEAVASAGLFGMMVLLLGAPPLAVFLFLILENVSDLWQHANVRIPARADRAMRLLLITPDMHRVHHSAERPETDSNFTILLTVWDRVFGTYREAPARGHEAMVLGLTELADPRRLGFGHLLLQPFRPPQAGTQGRTAA